MAIEAPDSPLSNIANLDAMTGGDGVTETDEVALREDRNNAQTNLDNLEHIRSKIQAQLNMAHPGSEEAANLAADLDAIMVSINTVASAISSGNPTQLANAASIGSATYNRSGSASTQASTKDLALASGSSAITMANMYESDSYRFASRNNLGGFNDLSEESQLFITQEVDDYTRRYPGMGEAVKAAEDIQNNEEFTQVREELLRNITADEKYLQENLKNKEILTKIDSLCEMVERNGHEYTHSQKYAEMMRQGASEEEILAELDSDVAEWDQKFADKADRVLENFDGKAREAVLQEVAEKHNISINEVTNAHVQEYIAELKETSPPNPKDLNDAIYVINKHGEEAAMQYLTADQIEAVNHHKILQFNELESQVQSVELILDSLTPEQLQEIQSVELHEGIKKIKDFAVQNGIEQEHFDNAKEFAKDMNPHMFDDIMANVYDDTLDRDVLMNARRASTVIALNEDKYSGLENINFDSFTDELYGDKLSFVDYGLTMDKWQPDPEKQVDSKLFINFDSFLSDDSKLFIGGKSKDKLLTAEDVQSSDFKGVPVTGDEAVDKANRETFLEHAPKDAPFFDQTSLTADIDNIDFSTLTTSDSVVYSGDFATFGTGGASPANTPVGDDALLAQNVR